MAAEASKAKLICLLFVFMDKILKRSLDIVELSSKMRVEKRERSRSKGDLKCSKFVTTW
jgi:hypothetical protein